ncbi:hypothetical protein PanWU01x14_044420 [Parasponia andersonii]|uniref:Uncharacterized protein n=1 Tax=Parasponia andersonii TaxID=3476 RepID=A0A2P5DP86_PARAD|nr:hypothetical protein PanWU01x14_044420 [Parasponia andersonii]
MVNGPQSHQQFHLGPDVSADIVCVETSPLESLRPTSACAPTMPPFDVGLRDHANQPAGLDGGAVNATERVELRLV